ncbi:oxygen-dependent protoporphyrinogen oxidase [Tamaricihabitans halophyticus]|uniref:Coproporphyrinogen III oxidase n=1 Tax=Tamaricihabitans halophyticus TaxID=1262583 RepID=A0A4R2R771_9PSEU|nr:protoporphyrinogen oxidase [Tamaricihabitans halophyticus]TCP55245.1 oxygen-dependent protoporphyrinogen oxidase [Tamaricihabitans halophyticus]
MAPRVAVVGGGISGAAAAYRLRVLLGSSADIVLIEQCDRLGGKLYTGSLAGHDFDLGAEAFLARRPEALELAGELGLPVVHPSGMRSALRAGGATVPLPAGTMLGVPATADSVAGVLSARGQRAVAAESSRSAPLLDGDIAVGTLLRERFDDELVDRLVDPLLGGVYAGGADSLGLRATVPALASALDAGAESVTAAVAGLLPNTPSTAPVFGTLPGGLAQLVDRLAEMSRARQLLSRTVREICPTERGWRLQLGAAASAHAPAEPELLADAVVLAVPAPAASKLLAPVLPDAATAFAGIELASMAVIGLALPPEVSLPERAGILIGSGERHADGTEFTAKAFTFSTRKWTHYGTDAVLLRGSVGKFADTRALRYTDAELVRLVRADLAELTGIRDRPLDAVVKRWGGGLPQYSVGHLDRVQRIAESLTRQPTLAIAGAALHGVGVPACIGTADAAARRVAGAVN